jgi:hypothetical protein
VYNEEGTEEASEKITIIEGPTPTFELIPGGWVTGIMEGPVPASVAVTRLRTFNGPELVERCYRAWRKREPIHLEYRSFEGLATQIPIVAARYTDSTDGQMLFLWVRLPEGEFEFEFDVYDEFFDDDEEEDYDIDDDIEEDDDDYDSLDLGF